MRNRVSSLCLGLIVLAFSALGLAQTSSAPASVPSQDSSDSGSSLGSAARTARVQKASHAKKVFTDDDMEASAGPLPKLSPDGNDNSDEILAAIKQYGLTHTGKQTEEAVHAWYDRYDQIIATTFQGNAKVIALRQENMRNGQELCQQSQDYQQCQSRQMAEQRGYMSDIADQQKNLASAMRIQQVLMKVKSGLMSAKLRYDWFKIRSMNESAQ